MNIVFRYFESFVSLFYPRLCLTCDTPLRGKENVICTSCMNSLPETGFHVGKEHPVMELFSGRLKLYGAMSLLFFDKGSRYRRLIYQLKYQGKKEAGVFLGKLIGSRIRESSPILPDYIVPVPLHKSKLRRRGFNQSTVLAGGIAQVLQIPVLEDALIRKLSSSTQTRKGRYERWQNVEGIFSSNRAYDLANKHVLLVDDVVTTGATLEAAGMRLLETEGLILSIATAAFTHG